jgi:hypothetical protein
VKKPPANEEGQPLGISNVDKSLWAKEVWPPFMSYRENFYYCTKYMTYSTSEQELYNSRAKEFLREDKILENVRLLLKAFSSDIEIPVNGSIESIKDDIEVFLDKKLYFSPALKFIEPRFIYPYNPKQGFSFAVDAIFQPPRAGFMNVLCSLNPPGA